FSSSFFFQAEDGIRDFHVTGVQTCALPIFMAVTPASAKASIESLKGKKPSDAKTAPLAFSFALSMAALTAHTRFTSPSPIPMVEIGRASCRERVEISVVSDTKNLYEAAYQS